MPIKNDVIVCINHPDIAMLRVDGFNAITSIAFNGDQIEFLPDRGVPVSMNYCQVCGYVENYLGPKTKGWDAIEEPNGEAFERLAIDVLRQNLQKLGISGIEGSTRLQLGNENVEVDGVGHLPNGGKIFFEVKNSSKARTLESGVNQLTRILTLYSKSFPQTPVYGALVVPESSSIRSSISGYPIVKVDLSRNDITFVAAPSVPSDQPVSE